MILFQPEGRMGLPQAEPVALNPSRSRGERAGSGRDRL